MSSGTKNSQAGKQGSALRTGFTTGTCAAAAAKAATVILLGRDNPEAVDVRLPDGSRAKLVVARTGRGSDSAWAAVRKDAGDDPDVTDGVLVQASVSWEAGQDVIIAAGEGIGTATKPGLSVPPGEPAINPVPRQMIRESVRELTDSGIKVIISIPGGEGLARKTFNPRLGIIGGLSILGTSGIVRPFSNTALRDSLRCSLSVAWTCDVRHPVFVPGRIGKRAAHMHFHVSEDQVIEVSNEWGFMLDQALAFAFKGLLVMGHPGKLAKLAERQWDTHSKRSWSAVPSVVKMAQELLGRPVEESVTVEGIFERLTNFETILVANETARRICEAVSERVQELFPVAAVLVNLNGAQLGHYGNLSSWL